MVRSEAYDDHPEHSLRFDERPVRLRILLNEQILAETDAGLSLREGHYPAVIYVPREHVRMDLLTRSDRRTHCPFKGDASYFDYASASPQRDEPDLTNVAWSYEDPFDQMRRLANHLAFYDDRVTLERLPE